jgi:hypothetical protein
LLTHYTISRQRVTATSGRYLPLTLSLSTLPARNTGT